MVQQDVVVALSGGAPWGFRLQGGAEHRRPLQVAKVRRRSKACRAGLKEDDELVAIGDQTCMELSHAQAMNLIDMQMATLNLRVKRPPAACLSSVSPCTPASRGALSPPNGGGVCITSPPDSEAYYGETDSDADVQTPAYRRPRRTPPHPRSPARYDSRDEEETTSEMSGYESAPDGGGFLHPMWEPSRPLDGLPGVPRRELVYEPPEERNATASANHTPHTLTPRTLTPTQDQGLTEGEGEVDSGFQDTGSCVPLVSPERAKEAMALGSSRQLVPMVGPQLGPISDELSTTYMDKAKQAKLQRGESVVEKQVKEARTKCRSIASLLTDAPNPNSKGVLMFKKRRQRAKKYTLTCFGKGEETEGDTGGETEEEEGGSSVVSGSEVEEGDFSASYDPTWDSGYLDLLDRRSSACPQATPTAAPTTPTMPNHSRELEAAAYRSPAPEYTGFNGVAYQGPGLEAGGAKRPGAAGSAPMMSPHAEALTNGASLVVSRASVILTPPTQAPGAAQAGHQIQHQQQNQQHQQYQNQYNQQQQNQYNQQQQNQYNQHQQNQYNQQQQNQYNQHQQNQHHQQYQQQSQQYQQQNQQYQQQNQQYQQQPANPIVSTRTHHDPAMNSEPSLLTTTSTSNATAAGTGVVLNRTARPFGAGPGTVVRAPVASVAFRPPQPRPATAVATVTAVSAVTIQPQRPAATPETSRRAVSSASLYISPRNNGAATATASPQPPPRHAPLSPQASLAPAQPGAPPSPQCSGPPAAFPPPSSLFPPPPLARAAQGPPSYQSPPHTQPLPSPPHPLSLSLPSPPHPQPFSLPSPPHPQPFSPASQSFPPPNGSPHLPLSSGVPGPPLPSPPAPHPPPPAQSAFQCLPPASPPQPPPPASYANSPPPPPPQSFGPYSNVTGIPVTHPPTHPAAAMATAVSPPPPPQQADALASREQRISVPAARTGILQEARRRANTKPMFCSVQNKDVSPNPELLSMLQSMDSAPDAEPGPAHGAAPAGGDAGHESGPEEDWLRLGAEACNFMQAQRGPRPPPVAPKPQGPVGPQMPQMEGKGGQLFARRQSRMDRYVVDRSPSVAAAPYPPAQPSRGPSPTPSLPATWKYSSSIRAPPPISYNPLLSPSCPLKAQKAHKVEAAGRAGHAAGSKSAAKKGALKPLEIMTHQPYQLNSSLFTYVPGAPQATSNLQQQQREASGVSQAPVKKAWVREVKRFSTPPPLATGPSLKILTPRSLTSLGEPTWRSEPAFAPAPAFFPPPPQVQAPAPALAPHHHHGGYPPQPSQWGPSYPPMSPAAPPAPTTPLPQLPHLSAVHQTGGLHVPTFTHLQGSGPAQATRPFISVPDLSPAPNGPRPSSRSSQCSVGGPRPRFSTSNLGLQPCVWRPGASLH